MSALILLLIWLGRMFPRASAFQSLVGVILSPTFPVSLMRCLVLGSILLSRRLHGSLSSSGHTKSSYYVHYPWSIKTLSNQVLWSSIFSHREAVFFCFARKQFVLFFIYFAFISLLQILFGWLGIFHPYFLRKGVLTSSVFLIRSPPSHVGWHIFSHAIVWIVGAYSYHMDLHLYYYINIPISTINSITFIFRI